MPQFSYFSDEPSRLVATCSEGAAPYLEREIRALGYRTRDYGQKSGLAVELEGTLRDCMRLNLHLRTAHRILYALDMFRARGPADLYNAVSAIPWERYILPDGYFSVDCRVDTPSINDTRYASLKVKDAIADRMRRHFGYRPDSGSERTGACVFLVWNGSSAAIYLDTSGESLSRRGYRTEQSDAPARESLAAAVIMASGWSPARNFLNPMCGCGTFAIEAAMIAANMPPAMLRRNFAFMHLAGFDAEVWTEIRRAAAAAISTEKTCRITASDIDSECVAMSVRNAGRAGVGDMIEFETCDFLKSSVPPVSGHERGVAVMNPPYGNRLGDPAALLDLYAAIGIFTEDRLDSYDTYVLAGNPEPVEKAGLTYEKSYVFANGGIQCELMCNPVAGSNSSARVRSLRRRMKRG